MSRRGRVKEDVKWARDEAARLKDLGSDPRRIAIELAKKRYKAAEVGGVLGVHQKTARGWIRESGEVPSDVELTEKYYGDGFGSDYIAEKLRITRRTAQRHLEKIRGKARQSHSVRQNVERFYADPAASMDERFVRSDAFSRELLAHCYEQSENPKAGLTGIDHGIALLEHLVENDRAEDGFNAQCRHIQCRGLKAHVLMRKDEKSMALDLLKANHELALSHGPCCAADSWRRLALGYGEVGQWPKGHRAIERAFACYHGLQGAGHDLLGNGIGSCYLTRSALRYYDGGPELGVADVEAGIRATSPDSATLYGSLLATMAAYLADSEIDTQRSRAFLQECRGYFEDKGPSETRLKIRWLEGLLARAERDIDIASSMFQLALDDAKATESECEAAAIVADLGKMSPSPTQVRTQVFDLCAVADDGTVSLPNWFKSRKIQDALQKVQTAAFQASRLMVEAMDTAPLDALRKAAAGPGLMPEFATS